jgi:hypothetical protein
MDGPGLARQDQGGGYFRQRFEDEAAEMRSRMGQRKPIRGTSQKPERDQIEIQGTRFVQDALGLAPELPLESLELQEQCFRRFRIERNEPNNSVDERR